jgi:hypothetical protein
MDPIGFGMENYDGIGAWRDMEAGQPVDSSGSLPGDLDFNGSYELAQLLVEDERYVECVSEKVLIYALGRGLHRWDAPQLHAIEDNVRASDGTIRDVITEVVLSAAFRMRRGGELPKAREVSE